MIGVVQTPDIKPLADPRVGGARDAPPPRGPNSFVFMLFSAKILKIIAILGVGVPPGENPGSATENTTSNH